MPRITKRTAALGLVVVAALGLGACASSTSSAAPADDKTEDVEVTKLLVATGASPKPYTYLDENDELTGYDIEILKLIDERLEGIEFQFEVAEFPALFAGLDSGRFDLVANNLSATEERREKYDFSQPYIEAQFGIATANGSGIGEVTKFEDLAGKRTYGTPGLNFTRVLEEYNAAHPDAQIEIEYTELDLQLQYQNLAAGLIDFTFAEQVVFKGYGTDAGLDLSFAPLDSDYLVDTYGTNLFSAYAFSKAEDHSEAIAQIDEALNELLADGTLSELSERFFDGIDVTPRG